MSRDPVKPLIVQADMTMLLEVDSPLYEEARNHIAPFADLIKSPEHIHTYRLTPISLWNASTAGLPPGEVIERLRSYSRYSLPDNLVRNISGLMDRFGRVRLDPHPPSGGLLLTVDEEALLTRFRMMETLNGLIGRPLSPISALVDPINRGLVKQALIHENWPVRDDAGYEQGTPLDITLREGPSFRLRPYQAAARDAFHRGGSNQGGSGVIVLPCGAGKTVVGMAAMAEIRAVTLILNTGITAVRQWKRELLEKTSLREQDIGEYSGEAKEIRPVTLTTYQILTYRNRRTGEFAHFAPLNTPRWGLVIFDEVHMLPAKVFRFTASLQAKRRLGLTATLVREDGREGDVFSLIGPKCYDVPWKDVERQGWIAEADCVEIQVEISEESRAAYLSAGPRGRFRAAAENTAKREVVGALVERHWGERVLVIGQYLDQLRGIAEYLGSPLITGATRQADREEFYDKFRRGEIKLLVVSSVANFAIDLPDAGIAVQVSGKFGSRQEEAQRLGRILRPKADGRRARFYTLVTKETEEQDFALNRQMFLTEEGYTYTILDWTQKR